jgi:hypothetical protein
MPKIVIITLAPGVDAMISIFCEFGQFLAFFSKTNAVLKFLQKLAVVGAKNSNFSPKICRKYF